MNAETAPRKKAPPFWVLSTYFAEGFPYSLVRQISTVFFRDHGASLEAVGMTSLYGLPWVLKFLWAPLADAFATKRRWLLAAEAALAAAALALAAGSALADPLAVASVLFLITAFLSASHDIAIDGYYLEALDREGQARYVGYQAMAYRLALIAGGGGIVWLSGVAGWSPAFLLSAALLAGLMVYHLLFLPKVEEPRRPISDLARWAASPRRLLWVAGTALLLLALRALWLLAPVAAARKDLQPYLARVGVPGWITLGLLSALLLLLANLPRLRRHLAASDSFYARAFIDYLDQPRIGVILAFLVLYRSGEAFLLAMVYPMLKDIGVDRAQYGLIYGTLGIGASIAGGILGGHLIGRFGLKRVIWPLVLAQNLPNLFYMLLALIYGGIIGHPERGTANLTVVALFVVLEAFGAGNGTAVFLVFIMRTCKPAYKAAHMSLATSVMNVASSLSGVLSGFLAHWLGYAAFFGFTFIATIPGMALIFFLPHLNESERRDAGR
ncbi:MAG: MFS transporter [Acidobacteriota bacterium]